MLKATKPLPPIALGINNRREAHDLPRGAVRDAVNVDLTDSGHARRRSGFGQVVAGASARSLRTIADRTFYADGTTLYEIRALARVALWTGLDPQAEVVFEEWTGRGICFSDGISIKLIVGNAVRPIAVDSPRAAVNVTAVPGGSLVAGIYQVAFTFQNAFGEESGALDIGMVEAHQNDKLVVILPAAIEPETTLVNVYVSAANDQVLTRWSTFAAVATTVEIPNLGQQGRVLPSDPAMPLPAGDMLTFRNGRMYSHANGVVSHTMSWSGLYRPSVDYIMFAEPLTVMLSTDIGTYFVGDETYYIGGEPKTAELRRLSPVRAVRGSGITLPHKRSVMWFSDRGLVLASVDGSIQFVQEANLAIDDARSAATLYRDEDGLRQVLTTLRDPGSASGRVGSWMGATISTKEVRDAFDE